MADLDELSPLDRAILDICRRYRLVTPWAVWTKLMAGLTLEAARSRLKRLGKAGWLKKPAKRDYYLLSGRAVRKLGLHRKATKPLGYEQRLEAMAVLDFCIRRGVEKYTYDEFTTKYPSFHRPGLKSSLYYVDDPAGENRVGLILVDTGKSPERLVRKVKTLLAQRHELTEFSELIHEYRFSVAIVTTCRRKAESIAEEIRAGLTENVVIHIEISEHLERQLLMRRTDGPSPARQDGP